MTIRALRGSKSKWQCFYYWTVYFISSSILNKFQNTWSYYWLPLRFSIRQLSNRLRGHFDNQICSAQLKRNQSIDKYLIDETECSAWRTMQWVYKAPPKFIVLVCTQEIPITKNRIWRCHQSIPEKQITLMNNKSLHEFIIIIDKLFSTSSIYK